MRVDWQQNWKTSSDCKVVITSSLWALCVTFLSLFCHFAMKAEGKSLESTGSKQKERMTSFHSSIECESNQISGLLDVTATVTEGSWNCCDCHDDDDKMMMQIKDESEIRQHDKPSLSSSVVTLSSYSHQLFSSDSSFQDTWDCHEREDSVITNVLREELWIWKWKWVLIIGLCPTKAQFSPHTLT